MKKLILTLSLFAFGLASFGQLGSWGDWGGTDDKKKDKKEEKKDAKTESDTAATEDDGWGGSDDGGWGSDDGGDAWGGSGTSGGSTYQKPVAKKQVFEKQAKVTVPYDSIRKLIIYKGVQELEDCEYCTEDSLYYRFKDWAKVEFGKKIFKSKSALGLDEKFQKINLKLDLPLNVKSNKFTSYQQGNVKINLTMWFQPYRYKYLFSNFIHEVPPTGTQTESQMVYFEYYQESKRNTEENNRYLKAIDDKVKAYIEEMRAALDDKPISLLDEDDW